MESSDSDGINFFPKLPTFLLSPFESSPPSAARPSPSPIFLHHRLSNIPSPGLKMVPEILLKSRDLNIRVEESSFRILITALCRVKRVSHAIEIFHRMIDDGFVVGPEICSFLLSSLCEQSDVSSSDVIGFSGELRKLVFSPGLIDYTNLIRFLVREGYGMEAANVLNQMKSDGIKPGIVCYNLVLKGAISIQDFELADKVFDELLLYGLVPDIRTYNIYIDGLCKQGKTGDGMKVAAVGFWLRRRLCSVVEKKEEKRRLVERFR